MNDLETLQRLNAIEAAKQRKLARAKNAKQVTATIKRAEKVRTGK